LHSPSHNTAPPDIYTLSLHDALPISIAQAYDEAYAQVLAGEVKLTAARRRQVNSLLQGMEHRLTDEERGLLARCVHEPGVGFDRSEEHTSELQSQSNLVCRLLLEKKK